jgi:hypothetical protein
MLQARSAGQATTSVFKTLLTLCICGKIDTDMEQNGMAMITMDVVE